MGDSALVNALVILSLVYKLKRFFLFCYFGESLESIFLRFLTPIISSESSFDSSEFVSDLVVVYPSVAIFFYLLLALLSLLCSIVTVASI